jgi:hypothetical protein
LNSFLNYLFIECSELSISEYSTTEDFDLALNLVVLLDIGHSFLVHPSCRYLIVVTEDLSERLVQVSPYLIINNHGRGVVTDDHPTGCVAEYAVLLDLREADPAGNDAGPLVLVNVVLRDVGTRVKENDAIVVIVNAVVLNPGEAGLNAEDAL